MADVALAPTREGRTTDVIGLIAGEHREILAIVNELLSTVERPPPLGHDRHRLAQRLVMTEARHEAVEGTYVWPAVRDWVPLSSELVALGKQQERKAKFALSKLERCPPGNARFTRLVSEVAEQITDHIWLEENEVLPQLSEHLLALDNHELAVRVERAGKLAPTRPRPLAPPIPGVLKLTALTAGPLDRVRDKLTRRGR